MLTHGLQVASVSLMVLRSAVLMLEDVEGVGVERDEIFKQIRHHAQAVLHITRRICGDKHLRTAHALLSHVHALIVLAVNHPTETHTETEDRFAMFKQALLELQQVAALVVSSRVL